MRDIPRSGARLAAGTAAFLTLVCAGCQDATARWYASRVR